MLRRSTDVLLAMGIAVATVIAVFMPGTPALLRVALALPLVLFIPGYTLVAAVFPSGEQDRVERLLFSVGLSIIVAALGGFALHWTTWGLQASSWVILLASITLVGCVISLIRRQTTCERVAFPYIWPSVAQSALFGLAALVVIGAVSTAAIGAQQPRTSGFTQLWAIPDDALNMIRLGVENHEGKQVDYILRIESQGQTLETWPPISLKSGERWEMATALTPNLLNHPDAAVILYRQDVPKQVYRHVVLLPNTK